MRGGRAGQSPSLGGPGEGLVGAGGAWPPSLPRAGPASPRDPGRGRGGREEAQPGLSAGGGRLPPRRPAGPRTHRRGGHCSRAKRRGSGRQTTTHTHTLSRGRRATSQRTATSARRLNYARRQAPPLVRRTLPPFPIGRAGADGRLPAANEKPPSRSGGEGARSLPPPRGGGSALRPASRRPAPPPAPLPSAPMRWLRGWGEGE